jgi:general secretion pathway protein K
MNRPHTPHTQQGSALLLAMLTVTLVATLAAASLWQQWQAVAIEQAQRQRTQASLILQGALDWARLILREDARSNLREGNPDHLGEPWATPLAEARLSTFLAADRNSEGLPDAFLAGEIRDMHACLNINTMVPQDQPTGEELAISPLEIDAFRRLYRTLGLAPAEIDAAANRLLQAVQSKNTSDAQTAPLRPQRLSQLSWLGISEASLKRLEPHLCVLPDDNTLINVNTASETVLLAAIPGLDAAGARSLIQARESKPFRTLSEAQAVLPGIDRVMVQDRFGVQSQFFEIRGQLRLDSAVISERSLVKREGLEIKVIWRERFSSAAPSSS